MSTPAETMTLPEALTRSAEAGPSRPAVTIADETLTYAELDVTVTALAASLIEQGVESGDRVALWMPNVPQFLIGYFAILRAGAIVVPVSTLLGMSEVTYILNNSGAVALIAAGIFDDVTAALPERVEAVRTTIVWGETKVPNAIDFDALCVRPPAAPLPEPASPDDLAVLIYTSGTTGRPKGAMLSHHNILSNAAACALAIEITPEDRFLTVLPLFHSFGATVCMVLPVTLGAHIVLLPRFNPSEVLQAFGVYAITVFAGVPAMYGVLLNVRDISGVNLEAMRICVTGGAPCPPKVLKAFRERFGVQFVEGYGPTEASPVVSVNPPSGVQKLGSVGPPIIDVTLRIADEEGKPLPTGEIGEILVKGPNVMQGYWQAPEATAETIVDGWLHTGDMGVLDDDGYLRIVDRKKDMIIVGGLNVYPREVEDVIYQIPEVADCAVIGEPSERRGEDVKAFVVLREGLTLTEDQVIDHCSEHLGAYKVPRSVVFPEDLPRSGTGKILKRALK